MGHLKLGSRIALLIILLAFLHRPVIPDEVVKGQREHFFFLLNKSTAVSDDELS